MDVALQSGDWSRALEASCRFIGADATGMAWQARSDDPIQFCTSPAATGEFAGYCSEILRAPTPVGEVDRDGATLRWMTRRQGVSLDQRLFALFALGPGPLDRVAFDCVATVAGAAVSAKQRLDATRCVSALKSEALDELPVGVAIVDAALTVHEANEACRAILRRCDGLSISQGKLACRARKDQLALTRAAADALSGSSIRDTVVRVSRAGGVQPYVVRPIGPKDTAAPRTSCLLMIVDPDSSIPSAARIWRAMFDLTDCELIIAEGMVAGRRITQIASERGVSVETVRSQTKRMFERLNVSSQAAATARLSRTAPFRAELRERARLAKTA
jgi:DNA-binding NarL/FixJ family response regulator